MIENPDLLNSAILGFIAFALSFVILYIVWSVILRIAHSFFSKSKFYFIPRLLKDIGRSVMFVIVLISVYFGVYLFDQSLLAGTPLKIWGI